MPRKHRQTKGQQPPKRKTERKQLDLVTRGRVITLRKEGYTERAIEQKLGVHRRTVHNIYRHALQQSMEFQIHIDDPQCLQPKPRPDRSIYPSEEEAQRIFEYTISTSENRRKTALQIINEL